MRLRHANRLASLFPGVRSSEYHVAPPMMHAWRPGENPDNTHKMRFTRSFEAIPDPNKAQKYLPALLFTSRSHFSSQSASSATSSLLARMHDPSIAARVAVVNADSSHATYSDLCKKSERLSLLLKPHLKRGDTLASFCSGSADYVVAMMAAWSLDWYETLLCENIVMLLYCHFSITFFICCEFLVDICLLANSALPRKYRTF